MFKELLKEFWEGIMDGGSTASIGLGIMIGLMFVGLAYLVGFISMLMG